MRVLILILIVVVLLPSGLLYNVLSPLNARRRWPYGVDDVYKYVKNDILHMFDMIDIDVRKKTVETVAGYRCMKHTYNKFQIWEIYDILNEAECNKIINLSKHAGFVEAQVLLDDDTVGNNDYVRKGGVSWVGKGRDPVIDKLSRIASSITKLPIENQEILQVSKYTVGQMFTSHYDPCIPENHSDNFCDHENFYAGARIMTFLLYLNDDFTGGETDFPAIPFTVRPKRGKAILFWNTDENEILHDEALHRGKEVISGEKYIGTIWFHIRAIPRQFIP